MPSAPASSSKNPWEIPGTIYLTEEEVERIGQSDEEEELGGGNDPWKRVEDAEKRLTASQRPGQWIDKSQTARNRARSIPSRLTMVNEDGQPCSRGENRPQKNMGKDPPGSNVEREMGIRIAVPQKNCRSPNKPEPSPEKLVGRRV